MEEDPLIRAWADGDAAAGERLMRLVHADVYAVCFKILANRADAEDAAQEALASAVKNRTELTDLRNFRAWLTTVASNAALQLKKRRARERPAELDELAEPTTAPADDADPETMHRALEGLPPRYRLALHYRFKMGLSLKQVAELLEVSESNVRVILHRAIQHARKNAKKV